MSAPSNGALTGIGFQGPGRFIRLSTADKWERAVRSGDLKPDTSVEVDRSGETETMRASEVPELAAYFPQPLPLAVMVDDPLTPARASLASAIEMEPQVALEAPGSEAAARPRPSYEEEPVPQAYRPDDPSPAPAPAQPLPRKSGSGANIGVAAVLIGIGLVVALAVLSSHPSTPAVSSAPVAAAPVVTSVPITLSAMTSWRAASDGTKTYSVDGITLTLSSRTGSDGNISPVLDLKAADGSTFEEAGVATPNPAAASFGVGNLDPVGPGNQILFTSFSGGAHCCTMISVLEEIGGAWKAIDIGSFEGELDQFPKDLDGGGAGDVVETDDRFAYAFASFAESYLPPKVYTIVRGQLVDASAAPRFAKLYRADMRGAQQSCLAHNNGACAAFVADASRLGLHDWAWQIMLTSYNPSSDWVLPTKCSVPLVNNACPTGQEQKFDNYPDALDWFLTDAGYVTSPALLGSSAPAAAAGPSFDCSRVQSDNLRLVCNTPDLAVADQALAAAYNEAMNRTTDRLALQNDERAWIARRAAAPADVDALKALYAQRIAELQALSSP
jgi:uncharacterized protein YecT (DUF1311 family)